MNPLHPPRSRVRAEDDALMQRVVAHVLRAGADGSLPLLAWHFGLSGARQRELSAAWPAASTWHELQGRRSAQPTSGDSGLLLQLRDLLLVHRADTDPAWTVLANVLSCACFGRRHLWQDLGASGRDEVSRLLQLGFPALHDSNTANLRWKRHLFLELGGRIARPGLRPPKCDGCDDHQVCFPAAGAATTAPLVRSMKA